MTCAVDKQTGGKSVHLNKQVNSIYICMYYGIYTCQQLGCWKQLIQVVAGLWSHLVRCCDHYGCAGLIMSLQLCCPHSECTETAQFCMFLCQASESRARWCWSNVYCQLLGMRPDWLGLTFVPSKPEICCPLRPTSVWSTPLGKDSLYSHAILAFVQKQYKQLGRDSLACTTLAPWTHCMVWLSL